MNNPLNATDPLGLCGGDGFVDNCTMSHDGGGGGGWGNPTYLLDGAEISAGFAHSLLGMGGAPVVQCPNNVCNGFRSNGSYAQYAAFANGAGGYFVQGGKVCRVISTTTNQQHRQLEAGPTLMLWCKMAYTKSGGMLRSRMPTVFTHLQRQR